MVFSLGAEDTPDWQMTISASGTFTLTCTGRRDALRMPTLAMESTDGSVRVGEASADAGTEHEDFTPLASGSSWAPSETTRES
jgi:hypothetical protein